MSLKQTELPKIPIIDIAPAACGMKDLTGLHRMQHSWPHPSRSLLQAACIGHSLFGAGLTVGFTR